MNLTKQKESHFQEVTMLKGNFSKWNAIERWLEKNDTSPMTHLKFPNKEKGKVIN